jgi:hypothetical protein
MIAGWQRSAAKLVLITSAARKCIDAQQSTDRRAMTPSRAMTMITHCIIRSDRYAGATGDHPFIPRGKASAWMRGDRRDKREDCHDGYAI